MIFLILFILKINCFSQTNNLDFKDVKRVEFFSEYALYDSSRSFITLSTSVFINTISSENKSDLNIKSDYAFIDLSSSTILFKSSFTVESSSISIFSKSGEINFKESKGDFNDSVSRYDRFIIRSKKVFVDNNKYIYKNASVTTCDQEPPHYHISSERLTFVPKKYFLSYNNIFFIGKVPILYFPVLYKPLGDGTPIISQFYPGYDSRNGFYIKSNYTYKFSRYTKLKAFVDYFAKKGWGFGEEVYKYKRDRIIFDLSYYTIDERGDAKRQWGSNGGLWVKLYSKDNKEIYTQSFIRTLSNPMFNNNYFRSNPFAVSENKQWEISMTYRMPYSYLRISDRVLYSRIDDYSFKETQNISPKIEYQMLTKNIGFMNLSHNFYTSFENSRMDSSYFKKEINSNYSLFNSFNIYKNLSFYNSFTYSGNYYFSNPDNNENFIISKYLYNSSLRFSTLSNSYEIGYNSVLRTKKNTSQIDYKSDDKGVEVSKLNLDVTLFSRINQYLIFHNNYDLKPYQPERTFGQRIGAFSVDYYKNYSNYEIYLKETYHISQGQKSFIAHLNSNYEQNYLNIGFANYSSNKDRFLISNTLGYYPDKTRGWYGEFVMRYYFDISKNMDFKFFEKGINLNKDFHDFRAKLSFRNRRNVNEIFFYITMKMNDKYRKNDIDKEVDEFFKPWRKFEEERDY